MNKTPEEPKACPLCGREALYDRKTTQAEVTVCWNTMAKPAPAGPGGVLPRPRAYVPGHPDIAGKEAAAADFVHTVEVVGAAERLRLYDPTAGYAGYICAKCETATRGQPYLVCDDCYPPREADSTTAQETLKGLTRVARLVMVGRFHDAFATVAGLGLDQEIGKPGKGPVEQPPEASRLPAPEHVAIMFCRAEGHVGADRIHDERAIRLEHLPREGEQSLGTLTFRDSKGRDPMELMSWRQAGGGRHGTVWWKMPVAGQFIERFFSPLRLLGRLAALGEVEQQLVARIIERLELGRAEYGPMNLGDGRDHLGEARDELLDATVYLAARLLRAEDGDA